MTAVTSILIRLTCLAVPCPLQGFESSALTYALILLVIAGAAAAYLNPESLLILVIAAGTVTIYSIFAKRNTFLSFLPVGISYGLVPVGIWLAFDPAGLLRGSDGVILPLPAYPFGLMMCVTDWAFTLGGVARDVEGDSGKAPLQCL